MDFQQLLFYVIALGFFICIISIIKWNRQLFKFDKKSNSSDLTRGHDWFRPGTIYQSVYCNICEMLILSNNVASCSVCGIFVDQSKCMTDANYTLTCKKISFSGSSFRHQWIKGNLPDDSFCVVCEEECAIEHGLCDFKCIWCQMYCHTECIPNFTEICDFGELKKFVVPPYSVRLSSRRIKKQLIINEIVPPKVTEWTPVIVIGNVSSGSNEAEKVLSSFRKILNPSQVIDLSKKSARDAIEWCHLLKGVRCKIIIAGGDGTVAWIFNTIYKLKLQDIPSVSILPLGTGNDLSRVLGWGAGHSGHICAMDYLLKVDKAKEGLLDRWIVHFTAPKILVGLRIPCREIFMNNYLSIGVDALVTLNFHLARESPFYLFSSRTINKFIYFTYGTKDVVLQECKQLNKKLELWLDDRKIELPELEALVVLNISSWGAGVEPWTMGQGGQWAPKQLMNDGKLEVFCVTSSLHIAQLQLGITEPVRIGQCSKLDIRLKSSAPMQVDGEPWQQSPGLISLMFSHQAKVLVNEQ